MKRDQTSEQVPHRGDSGGVARAASHPAQGAQKQQRLPAVQIAEQLRQVSHEVFSPPRELSSRRAMLQVCGKDCVGSIEVDGWLQLVSVELSCLTPAKAEAIMRLLVQD